MDSYLINWTLSHIDPQSKAHAPPADMRQVVSQIKALPPLPGSSVRIINLISDPKADVEDLVEIIEMDPLLTAQIIRWASSSLYGYRGKITTVHDAITRVLGFNFVLDLILGLAVLAPLKAPKDGRIGTRMFWTHALASSRLMKLLAECMPIHARLSQKEVFLAAFMHNIGFPLLGHQFPEQFAYLSKMIGANPLLPVFSLENFCFGVNHAEIGAWLMNAWSMPRVITDIVYHHHNPSYRGQHHRLNLLTYVNDCLLGQIGIGDATEQSCPDEAWLVLELDRNVCQEILENKREDLEKIADTAQLLTE